MDTDGAEAVFFAHLGEACVQWWTSFGWYDDDDDDTEFLTHVRWYSLSVTERRRISNCVSNSQLVPDVITEGIASVSALSAFVLFSFSNGHINV